MHLDGNLVSTNERSKLVTFRGQVCKKLDNGPRNFVMCNSALHRGDTVIVFKRIRRNGTNSSEGLTRIAFGCGYRLAFIATDLKKYRTLIARTHRVDHNMSRRLEDCSRTTIR